MHGRGIIETKCHRESVERYDIPQRARKSLTDDILIG